MSDELVVSQRSGPGQSLEPAQVLEQVNLIQQVMRDVMKPDEHYGIIPGCGKKPALLKPGAEKLSLLFQIAPSYTVERKDHPRGHREYEVCCTLTHIPTGNIRSQGLGACSTLESKYRYRNAEGVVTDRPVPSDYWTMRNLDPRKALDLIGGPGHGTKKTDAGWMITKLAPEKVEHDNPADYWNTCLKIAKKRAYIDAMLSATAASDIFVQDLEEEHQIGPGSIPIEQPVQPPQQQRWEEPPAAKVNRLRDDAIAKFNSMRGQMDQACLNYGNECIQNHRYQDLLNWLNGGR